MPWLRGVQGGSFPNSGAVIRLIGTILTDLHDEWIADCWRHLSERSMAKLYETSGNGTVAAI